MLQNKSIAWLADEEEDDDEEDEDCGDFGC